MALRFAAGLLTATLAVPHATLALREGFFLPSSLSFSPLIERFEVRRENFQERFGAHLQNDMNETSVPAPAQGSTKGSFLTPPSHALVFPSFPQLGFGVPLPSFSDGDYVGTSHTSVQSNSSIEPQAPAATSAPAPAPTYPASAQGLSQGMVSINFDDGEASAYREAVPRLEAAGFKGTFYITTGFLGESGSLTEDNVRALARAGHEIGAHTRTHPHLPDLSTREQRDEIIGSKNDLLGLGVAPVPTFAYPFGEFDDRSVNIARENFSSARTAMGGFTRKGDDPYLLEVQTLRRRTSMREVEEWINAAREDGHWQILVFHRIDDSSDEYSTSPDMFQDIIDYLTLHRVPVVTMEQGLRFISS